MTRAGDNAPGTPRLYDVACAAKLSIAAVSNILKRPASVPFDVLDRVLEAADSVGYTYPFSRPTAPAPRQPGQPAPQTRKKQS